MNVLHPRQKMTIITDSSMLSPPFNSRSPRLPVIQEEKSPGPGTYGIPILDKGSFSDSKKKLPSTKRKLKNRHSSRKSYSGFSATQNMVLVVNYTISYKQLCPIAVFVK